MFFRSFKSNNILVKCVEIAIILWYSFFMERIKLVVQYNGKDFCGWQVQPNKRTVEGELEKVLEFLLKEKVKTFASGRTDAGVSSYGQVVHFDTEQKINISKLHTSLNGLLPSDMAVTECEKVSNDFDARFSVKRKTYRYNFYISRFELPLFKDRAFRVNDYVNLVNMREACKYLIGEHNFESFVSQKSGKTDFVRTIYDANIVEIDSGLYTFEITGNGFLYNMVRIIFGTLLSVGYGKSKPEDIAKIIESRSRPKAGRTMPAYPLFMFEVEY